MRVLGLDEYPASPDLIDKACSADIRARHPWLGKLIIDTEEKEDDNPDE